MNNQPRKSFVAGNWKMNGSVSLVNDFAQLMDGVDSNNVEVAMCPPACLLGVFSAPSFGLGAQDISHLDEGAHTGDLAAAMLKEVGCQYVIVGHSERREDHSESNELVAQKALKALAGGLTPIICIGESLDIRESGQLEAFLGEQISALTAVMSADNLTNSIIAYEPVWAIGTGKTASPQQAQDVHHYIRQALAGFDESMAAKIRILYGGSVKSSNAKELFAQVDIDGGLIGGASLKVDEFRKICQAAN